MTQFKDEAIKILSAGINVLPAILNKKCPGFFDKKKEKEVPFKWAIFQKFVYRDIDVFNDVSGICVVGGKISGNLEIIDFDSQGCLFKDFINQVKKMASEAGIPDRLDEITIEQTPSGGYHLAYQCDTEVDQGKQLAYLKINIPVGYDEKEYEVFGKKHPVSDDGFVYPLAIETRSEKNICVISPTPGYCVIQNDWLHVPQISEELRCVYLNAAKSLNQRDERAEKKTTPTALNIKPGNTYSSVADQLRETQETRRILQENGWECVGTKGVWENWKRPGKIGTTPSGGINLETMGFHCFTSNAPPLESGQTYTPLQLYAAYYHNGDISSASKELCQNRPFSLDTNEKFEVIDDFLKLNEAHLETFPDSKSNNDISESNIQIGCDEDDEDDEEPLDAPEIPDDLLYIPGFIGGIVDFCRDSAPFFNQTACFCGALALQSFLCGRKIQSESGLRTNIYIVALAHSCSGKDYIRKVNNHVMYSIGKSSCLGETFASGEGLQDALKMEPCMLFQNDEFDLFFQSIKEGKDSWQNTSLSGLLTYYTGSSSVIPLRKKSGGSGGEIDQPHLTIFGTAPPDSYYQSLNQRMMSGGLLSRFLILDSNERIRNKTPRPVTDMPEKFIDHAKYWRDYSTNYDKTNNLASLHPRPDVVPFDEEARNIFDEFSEKMAAEYDKAHAKSYEIKMACYGRAIENAVKLALIYTASDWDHDLTIYRDAALWSTKFIEKLILRQLIITNEYYAENDFKNDCNKVLRAIKTLQNQNKKTGIARPRDIKRKVNMPPRVFEEVIKELVQQERIEFVMLQSKTRPFSGFVVKR